MTREEAAKKIENFGLYHAIGDLPYSSKTVEAFKIAIEALGQPEIIYCKECIYCEEDKDFGYWCGYWNGLNEANFFCSQAKRKNDESYHYETRKQPEPCDSCSNLENGDTLYQSFDWDGGIGVDYIRDIQFCPKCGRRLE